MQPITEVKLTNLFKESEGPQRRHSRQPKLE